LTSQSPQEPESGPPALTQLCETFCTSSTQLVEREAVPANNYNEVKSLILPLVRES
jgi:hypothetical protein